MINVDGYKAFRGTMKIYQKNISKELVLYGDWLYKPDYKCWYGNGKSYPEEVCEVLSEKM